METKTERRQSSWELVGTSYTCTRPDGQRAVVNVNEAYPEDIWDIMTDVQKFYALYGMKQVLADRTIKADDIPSAMLAEYRRINSGEFGRSNIKMSAKKTLLSVAEIMADPSLTDAEKVALVTAMTVK